MLKATQKLVNLPQVNNDLSPTLWKQFGEFEFIW